MLVMGFGIINRLCSSEVHKHIWVFVHAQENHEEMKELQWNNTEYLCRQEQKEKVEWKSSRSTGEDMFKKPADLLSTPPII